MKDKCEKEFNNKFNNIGVQLVKYSDLPLACPGPKVPVWNAHPRVYLPIAETREAVCPYCGAQYILKE
jgi:uncharacterized Zn-finger protein